MKVRFDQLAINVKEKKKPTEEDRHHYIGLEHLDSGSLTISRWGADVAPQGEKLLMKKGDVLFGKRRAYQKKVAIAPFDGIFSAHGMVLRPNEKIIDKAFFPLFISSDYFLDAAIALSVGSLSPTINWKDLARLEFELPSLEKQRELAEVLWAIEDTRTAYQRLGQATDELVKARFVEMFGDPVTNPMGWETAPLAELGELNRGVSKHRPRNTPELLNGPYPLVQTGDVANADTYIKEYSSTYSEIGLKQSRMWSKGALCITIAANIAKTGILTFDACFPDSVVGFIAGERTNQLYIHYWFSFFQKILEEQAPQSAQKNINLQILKNMFVVVPPIELQNKFVAFVKQVGKSKVALKKMIDIQNSLRKSIVHNYLSIIYRGEKQYAGQ